MKRELSAAAHAITPPIVWNAYLRLRNRKQTHPWVQFKNMGTNTDTKPLFTDRFAEIHERYRALNPFAGDNYRYLHYNYCFFASMCCDVPGDFVCAGVAFGSTAKVVYEFVDLPKLGKTLHLIDPFDALQDGRAAANYNSNPDYVMRQYPPGAPVVLHRDRIPIQLPGPLAYVFCDTGNPAADAEALPSFYEAMSPGGIFITNMYGNNVEQFGPALRRLGVRPLWLPSGQGVIFKAR